MDDLNKDEHIHDRETQKKLPHQPLSSSNSVFSEMKFPSIGPAIAGIYMQTHQEVAKGATTGSFPSAISYNLIFLTAALISVISITLVIILRRKITQSQSTLKKLEIESSVKKRDAL
jgi:hypothetical protein